MADSDTLYRRARRRAGRVKRWVRRRLHERRVGRQYRAWLAEAAGIAPGSTERTTVISILVPVYNTPPTFLSECLESVLAQQSRSWQLVVVDDGSTNSATLATLDAFAAAAVDDPRVIVLRQRNGGISSALNAGLAAATGDYVGMLDHDDRLDPRCIEEFGRAVEEHDLPDAVYSDEDKIDERGQHFELYCKPTFSPELLLSQMYLCHFTVFRRADMVEVGGLRPSMDGAQDFDLALRLLPRMGRVVHLAQPLYHWRAWRESTARSIDAKPWAQEAAARVQREHLDRTYGGGSVQPSAVPGLNDVHPRVDGDPLVSVIIPTIGTVNAEGTRRLVDDAVRSLIERESNATMEFIIVTTGVIPDVHFDMTGRHRIRHVVYEAPVFNFAAAINLGRSAATGEYLLLLNDDTAAAEPNPVTRLLEIGQIPGVGIVGCRLSYPDGRLQHVGIVLLPSGPTHPWISRPARETGYFGCTLTPRNYLAVTAAAMLVRTEVFDALGGLDPAFARDFNDVDFCLRAHQSGHRVAWTPYAHFTHYESASIVRKKPDPAEATAFASRWSSVYPVDPYYSPALDPALARLYEAR